MKEIYKVIVIGLLLSSCSNSSTKTGKVEEAAINTELINTVSSTVAPQVPSETEAERDCIFDMETQNDDFIKNIPEFSNYTWNDATKTAIITLENGERIIAKRGGCDHFEISGQWKQKNKKHTIEEVEHWLEQGKWISKRIMTEVDYSELEQMIKDKSYDLNFDDNRLYVAFNNHYYSEWYLTVEWDFDDGDNNVIVETGYYFE